MTFLETDSLYEAKAKLLSAAEMVELETETIGIAEAAGRVLAEPVAANIDVPDFPKSTVDGYAVMAKDTQGAGECIPCFLDIVGEVHIGTPASIHIEPGQCAYVPTGGMLPDGADAVVMVEHVELFSSEKAAVYNAVSPGRNVIQPGEDVSAGEPLLKKGVRITPGDIGLLAATGKDTVNVYIMPSVTILSTGDELVSPGAHKQRGQVYDINSNGVAALCRKFGLRVRRCLLLSDDVSNLETAVSQGMSDSDIVILSGGSSKGKADHTADILDRLASPGVFTHGISLKPGKPTILASDKQSRTLLVGLPGHPMAAMIVFDLLLLGTLKKMMDTPEEPKLLGRMETNVAGGNGRTVCQPVQLLHNGSSEYLVRPVLGKSGLISVLAKADGYVMINENQEGLKQGELVEVTRL